MLVLLIAVLPVLCGCSDGKLKTYPVSGQVLYNGQPLKKVDLAFHAVDPKNDIGYPPHATTDDEGKFVLAGYMKDDGAPAGEYKVAIAFIPEPNVADEGSDQSKRMMFQLPEKYLKKETGIAVTVKPGVNTLEPFKLEGPPMPKSKR